MSEPIKWRFLNLNQLKEIKLRGSESVKRSIEILNQSNEASHNRHRFEWRFICSEISQPWPGEHGHFWAVLKADILVCGRGGVVLVHRPDVEAHFVLVGRGPRRVLSRNGDRHLDLLFWEVSKNIKLHTNNVINDIFSYLNFREKRNATNNVITGIFFFKIKYTSYRLCYYCFYRKKKTPQILCYYYFFLIWILLEKNAH